MTAPIPDHELLAYADGELHEDRREAVERALADHPHLAARIDELAKLRQTSRQTIHNATPKTPDSLRQKIAGLDIDSAPLPLNSQTRSNVQKTSSRSAWPWRIAAMVAAAVLLIAVGGWLYVLSLNSNTQLAPIPNTTTYTLAELAESVTDKHLWCADLEDHFVDPNFPRSINDLGPAAEKFMSQPVLTPDLTSIGYEFAGAGPCHIPGGLTLHLLYRSTETGEFISLFSQKPPWKVELADGHQAIGAGPDADHPLLIWRAGDVMYYLVCDDFGACQKAVELIGMNFKS